MHLFLQTWLTLFLLLCCSYFVAGVSNYEGKDYVDFSKIEAADPITFLWVEWFPLGFYAPAVLPLLIGYLVTTTETVGDIAATYEVSNLRTDDGQMDESIQGGLLSDAICSILSALFTSMPNTTFSQNNGVIALVRFRTTVFVTLFCVICPQLITFPYFSFRLDVLLVELVLLAGVG